MLAVASDLEDTGLPVIYDEDKDHALVIAEYQARTDADLAQGKGSEHEIAFEGLVLPPRKLDVIGFRSKLAVRSAKDERRKDLLIPERKRGRDEYSAVLPFPALTDRRGDPLMLAAVELAAVQLKRPGYEVEELEVMAHAVVVEDRESQEIDATVADRFVEISRDISVRVTAIELKGRKGMMQIKLEVKRPAGQRGAVIDSIFAINADGDVIGGGRWVNELDIFDDECDYEMEFMLQGDTKADKLRVVLATDYEVIPVRFTVEKLFQR